MPWFHLQRGNKTPRALSRVCRAPSGGCRSFAPAFAGQLQRAEFQREGGISGGDSVPGGSRRVTLGQGRARKHHCTAGKWWETGIQLAPNSSLHVPERRNANVLAKQSTKSWSPPCAYPQLRSKTPLALANILLNTDFPHTK